MYVDVFWLRRRLSRGNKKSHFYQSYTFSCEGVIMISHVGGGVGLLLLLVVLLLCVCWVVFHTTHANEGAMTWAYIGVTTPLHGRSTLYERTRVLWFASFHFT